MAPPTGDMTVMAMPVIAPLTPSQNGELPISSISQPKVSCCAQELNWKRHVAEVEAAVVGNAQRTKHLAGEGASEARAGGPVRNGRQQGTSYRVSIRG